MRTEFWYHTGFEKGDKVVLLEDMSVHNFTMLRKNRKQNTVAAGTRCVIDGIPASLGDRDYSVTLIHDTNGIPSGSVIRDIPERKLRVA